MKRIVVSALFLFLLPAGARAQDGARPDPAQTDADKYHVILKNERVRVLDYLDHPGDKTTQHFHPDFVLYALSDFQRRLTFPDGTSLVKDFKVGDVIYMHAQTHIGENVGDTDTHVVIVELQEPAPLAAPHEVGEIPSAKQTTLGLYLTAAEAYGRWEADPEHATVIDVRTPEEYMFVGHAAMAWNIPYSFQGYDWDSAKEHFAMQPNAAFVTSVKAIANPGDTLYVMCRSGTRSARAVNALAEAGFTNVYSIVDGMEGDAVKDPASPSHGKRVLNGWKNAGLPWTYETDPARMRLNH
jgi:rhodanese-related sulfurtransferase